MAKFNSDLSFSGSIGNLSVYRMRGVDKPVVRTKGGASRDKIRKLPAFAPTRQLNAEWGGCSKAGTNIRMALSSLKQLADYNFSGSLNAIAKAIQNLDIAGVPGQRTIYISKYCHSLEGFSLNKGITFNNVIKQPISCTLDRYTLDASLQIPQLIPGINFYIPGNYPLFRIIAELGVVPDMVYTSLGYQPANTNTNLYHISTTTDWASTGIAVAAQTLTLALNNNIGLDATSSLMLSIGIEFGMPLTDSLITPVKNAGCAKILALI
jgi:hypothetical protein